MSDTEIQDHLAPIMNPSIDWIQQILTPEEKVNVEKSNLDKLKVDLILPECEISEVTYNMLTTEQKQEYDLTKMLLLRDESGVIMILGPPGSGKSTTIHSITKMVDDILNGSVLRLGTTGAAACVIAGTTYHSNLRLTTNIQFQPIQESALRNL